MVITFEHSCSIIRSGVFRALGNLNEKLARSEMIDELVSVI